MPHHGIAGSYAQPAKVIRLQEFSIPNLFTR